MVDPIKSAYRLGRGWMMLQGCFLNGPSPLSAYFYWLLPCFLPHPAPSFSRMLKEHLQYWHWPYFLADRLRSQKLRVNGVLSNILFYYTSSPQGFFLSPLLFVLYTNESRSNHEGHHIFEFVDDSIIVSLLSSNDSERVPFNLFKHECGINERNLHLHMHFYQNRCSLTGVTAFMFFLFFFKV